MNALALVQAPANRYNLSELSDSEVLAGARRVVGTSNQLLADLLAHLAEVEARGIHRLKACASLYTYCIYELRFSEDEAFRRASAARWAKTFLPLLDAVAAGELHLTGLLMLAPHLTQQNLQEMLLRARFRTKRELAKLIREIDPLPDVPAKIEPLGPADDSVPKKLRAPTWAEFVSLMAPVRRLKPDEEPRSWIDPELLTAPNDNSPNAAPARVEVTPLTPLPEPPQRYRVQFTATQEYAYLVDRAKALLSSAGTGCSIEELHLRAMQALVDALERRKLGSKRAHSEPEDAAVCTASRTSNDVPRTQTLAPRQRGRAVPKAIRRTVYERDEARCTYADERGERCRETQCLELHHLHAFALGGAHTVDNLTLRCRAHNALAAEDDLGRGHMSAKQATVRHESLRRQRAP